MHRLLNIGVGVMLAMFLACGLGEKSSDDAEQAKDSGNIAHPQFAALYSAYLSKCANCHAPDAPGRTPDTETSLDFSTVDTAFASLRGVAAGLQGNVQTCNNVKFIGSSYETSLLAAVLDENVRANFNSGDCSNDNITDMTVKLSQPPDQDFLNNLKKWIDSGAK